MDEAKLQTIELDCPPGNPRPGDLIAEVIAGTTLPKRNDIGRVFGCWTWDYSDIPCDEWEAARPILKRHIEDLYRRGWIRFGSW